MKANPEQLWAEALAMVKDRCNPRLPELLRPAAEDSTEAARMHDSHIADLLAECYGELVTQARKDRGMTLTEIALYIGAQDRYDRNSASVSKHIRNALRTLEWERSKPRRRRGKLVRLWYPPQCNSW